MTIFTSRVFFQSLRLRLFLLIFLAILPALGLIAFVIAQQYQLAVSQAQENILKETRASASLYEQLLGGTQQLLPSLARVSAVQEHDAEACNAIFASLLTHYPSYANLAAIDTHGDMFCSVLPIPETRINVADRLYFTRTLAEQNFVVGEYQMSRITGEPVVTLAFPTLDTQKRPLGLVFAGLSLTWLNRQIKHAEIPPGAVLRLMDYNGTILVHSLNASHWVGQPMPETHVWEAMQAQREGWVEATGADGTRRLFTFAPIHVTTDADMYVCLDIPTDIVYTESNRISQRNLIALGLVGVLALAAGRVAGDAFILRRVNTLVRATQRLSLGDLSARTGLPRESGELSQLANAFDTMASTLEMREQERRRMEEALRASVHRAEALVEVAGRLNARLELNDVVHAVCEQAARALNVPAASVCLYDADQDHFNLVAAYGLPTAFREQMLGVPGAVYHRLMLQLGAPILLPDISTSAELPYRDLFASLNLKTMVCVSLLREGEMIGILNAFTIGEPRAFTNEEMLLLRGLSAQAALAIANARLYAEVKQQEQARAVLLRQTITAQEDERMRIARELHDETSQDITALMVGLDTANLVAQTDARKARTQLETTRGIAKNMLGGIHRLIADLRPSLLDHRGLVPAIAWYGDKRLKPLGIELHLETNLEERLPPLMETCLFRIVQESMTNVIRHAQATQVVVRLMRQDNYIAVRLSDNGSGFDVNTVAVPDEAGKGFGLQGMRERVSILAGEFDIQSNPGCGTTITIRVPLAAPENLHVKN